MRGIWAIWLLLVPDPLPSSFEQDLRQKFIVNDNFPMRSLLQGNTGFRVGNEKRGDDLTHQKTAINRSWAGQGGCTQKGNCHTTCHIHI